MNKEITMSLIKLLLNSEETTEEVKDKQGKLKIVILQRGWIFIGKYFEEGNNCWLEDASCIRNWGTTKGLGELAGEGKKEGTKLDPTPIVRFHKLGVVATIDCNEKVWK